MSPAHSIGWNTMNRAAEAEGVEQCLQSMDQRFIRSMTVAAMQSMLVSMHNPKPDSFTIELNNEATLGLAELLFAEWDRSGFTEIVGKLAPLALSLNTRARAQLFALEQEMLSPLCIPAEAWSLIWQDFDRKAALFEKALTRKDFRFSDSLADLEQQARDPEDKVYDLDVPGGNRVLGTGVPILTQKAQTARTSPWPPAPPPWPWPPTFPWPWPPGPGPTFPVPPESPGPTVTESNSLFAERR